MKRVISISMMLLLFLCGCAKESAKEEEKITWTLTQYQDVSGSQANFYTIVGNHGRLIVIDGGTENNAEYLKQIICENGQHVDMWILTHPHPDHIGAFNRLLAEGEIEADRIYDNGLNYDFYAAVAKEWDGIESYETYLELTEGIPEVQSLKAGEVLTLDNLTLSFYNSYYEGIDQLAGDIPNNSSLVFSVSAGEKSMLFVGDCYDENLADKWIQDYGDSLKADYVQMGHHGNHSLPVWFYEYVEPKGVFFDAPEWLMNGEQYDTKKNREAMERIADRVYDYGTCPNEVSL